MRNLRDEIVMSIREEDIDKIAEAVVKKLLSDKSDLMHWVQSVNKTSDDALMHLRLKDIANVNKVVLTGPPSQYQPSSTAQGAGNRVVFSSYTFTPNDAMEGEKYPLIFFRTAECTRASAQPPRILSRSSCSKDT
jgi:hypothetical protein